MLKTVVGLLITLVISIFAFRTANKLTRNILGGTEDIADVIQNSLMKILTTHFQMMSILFTFPLNYPKDFLSASGVATSATPDMYYLIFNIIIIFYFIRSKAFSLDCILK